MQKHYTFDTHRVCDPKITVKNVLEVLKSSGVWENEHMSIRDIGQLDIFHEHVYAVGSDVGRRNNWGKWLSKYQALASALMEFCERYSWYKTIDAVNETELKTHNQVLWEKVYVEDLILSEKDKEDFIGKDIHDEIQYHWVEWYSLTYNKIKHIPWYEYEFMTTNCLWAWNTKEEAILHAIYETIERHLYNVMMANFDTPWLIPIQTISNAHIQKLIQKIQSYWFEVYILDCSFDFGIHTIWALIYNGRYQFVSHYAMNLHMGTHANRDIAIIRALTEVIQNRATNLDNNKFHINMLKGDDSLSEKDLSPITLHYLDMCRRQEMKIIPYISLENTDNPDISKETHTIVTLLEKKGFEVLVIDATQKNINIPCVRVVIPWLQPMIFELFDDLSSKDIRFSKFIKR
jgi:YcaO-like protein with predicted kinase domain